MNIKAINATKLRLILAGSLLLLTVLGILLVVTAYPSLKNFSSEVSQITANADASEDSIQTLQKIQQELLINKDSIERASEIVAESQSYQYQDQIVTDLNDYANKAGITISNIDFETSSTAAGATTPPAATTSPSSPAATAAPAGVKSTIANITLKNPVNYESLLRFIKHIEQNLTKMQISNITMAKDTNTGGITSGALNLEVYIK